MTVKYSVTARNNRMTSLNGDIGAGAKIRLYSGTRPANVAASITGNLLVELTGAGGSFGAVSGGVLTAGAIASGTAVATGLATHARIFKADGTTAVVDVDVGTTGTELIAANANITSGQVVSISSLTFTDPNS